MSNQNISRRSAGLEINRVNTWTFQRFSASIDVGVDVRGETPARWRLKTWTYLESPSEPIPELGIAEGSGPVRYRQMPTIQILLSVTKDVGTDTDDGPGPGHRFVFTNDLALERYDDSTPGSGLPVDPLQRRAGTHSGVVTLVRVADATDDFFPDGSELWAYDATYKSTPSTTLLCRRGRSLHEAYPSFRARTAWIYQFGLRCAIPRSRLAGSRTRWSRRVSSVLIAAVPLRIRAAPRIGRQSESARMPIGIAGVRRSKETR
jgi:hypothetical protein